MVKLLNDAMAQLWAVEVGIDADGEVTTNTTGLDEAVKSNLRLLARGVMPSWTIVGLAATPEAGQAMADAVAAAIREGQPKNPSTREAGEDG